MYRKRRSPFLRKILRGSDAKRTCRSTCSIDKLSMDRRRTRPPLPDDAVESERHDGARGRASGGGRIVNAWEAPDLAAEAAGASSIAGTILPVRLN